MPIVCSSAIDRVTIYARGAVVTRALKLPPLPPEGPVELEIPGVTALAEPGSLRVSLEGQRHALSARALEAVQRPATSHTLPEQARELRHRIDRLKDEIRSLQERRERLSQLTPDALPGAVTGVNDRVKLALGAGKLLEELLARLDARWFEQEEALREASRQLTTMELQLKQSSSGPQDEEIPTRSLLLRLGGSGKLTRAEISYVVAPARWWPLYTLRVFEGRSASLTIEALVAQLSGEDWSAAQLSFATSDLVHDARMPELASLRLGRKHPPPRTGYRPPPPGLDQLFSAYDRYFPELVPPKPIPEDDHEVNYTLRDILRGGALTEGGKKEAKGPPEPSEELDEADLLETEGEACRPEEMPRKKRAAPPPPRASGAFAPALAPQSMPAPAARTLVGGGPPGGAGGVTRPPVEEASLALGEQFLDLSRLRLGGPDDRHRRGRLYQAIEDARSLDAMRRIEAVQPPVGTVRDPRQSRGHFAYRYEATARGTVPSDGVPHLVPVVTAQAPMRASFRAIPRESQEVYREAHFTNPFEAPLLTGPVQVYVDHSLLTTTTLDKVGKGGVVKVGLGTEPRLRVARNTQVQEGTSGLLVGSTVLQEQVRIELVSSLGHPVDIEVLERQPISDDKQIVVERVSVTPEAQPYDQAERGEPVRGGLRWALTLPPAGTVRLEHSYRITLPAKFELVGGNRRD
jgi:hypothetical protein